LSQQIKNPHYNLTDVGKNSNGGSTTVFVITSNLRTIHSSSMSVFVQSHDWRKYI